MAQRFYADPANFGVGLPVIGANSITFSEADPIVVNSSGFLDLASTSSKILGFSLETIGALTSDNQTVAGVCPKYVYAEGVLVVFPIAAAVAATQTMLGEYFIFSGTTSGAFTLNATSSATVGQLLALGLNPNNQSPNGAGSTTAGTAAELSELVVRAAFKQTDAYASS